MFSVKASFSTRIMLWSLSPLRSRALLVFIKANDIDLLKTQVKQKTGIARFKTHSSHKTDLV